MNTLLVFGIVVGVFIVVQGAAARLCGSVQRALERLPSLLPNPSGGALAIEIDPPCGEVTYAPQDDSASKQQLSFITCA
jgi:hypothetical protein